MERFKVVERETKTKAYSKEGKETQLLTLTLGYQYKEDPADQTFFDSSPRTVHISTNFSIFHAFYRIFPPMFGEWRQIRN